MFDKVVSCTCLLVVLVSTVYCQFEDPEFSISPQEACLAYPGHSPVNLTARQQSRLLPLGLTQYKVQREAQCVRGIFIRFEAIPAQLTVAVCQDDTDERLFRVLYNVSGRCNEESGFSGFVSLLDASITSEGPSVRFIEEVTLEDVTNGTLIRSNTAQNTGDCDPEAGFVSAPLSNDVRGLLTLATSAYKVYLRQTGACPIDTFIFQEQVPERLLADICINEDDDSVFQAIFNVTSLCLLNGTLSDGQGTARNDLFTAQISTIPTGIIDETLEILDTKIPENPPLLPGFTLIEGGGVDATLNSPQGEGGK
eukprot:TRINITY_DN6912_c0_g1_i3.p1 TRINITY_DN6912_c0_g1~~TRINITY_DN6912_c0_g1_i3.p1  ORF type:complete len:310 (+),score=35.98 TRINITY_DN6912_c0_g1_i3:131-1060(+)